MLPDPGAKAQTPGVVFRSKADGSRECLASQRQGYFEVHTRMTHTGEDTHRLAGAEAPAPLWSTIYTLEGCSMSWSAFEAKLSYNPDLNK